MNEIIKKMTPRERWLAAIVASIVFFLVNLVLLKLVLVKQAALRSELASTELSLSALETLSSQKELWTKRDEWLRATQPRLASTEMAGVELLEQVRAAAKTTGVEIVNPSIGVFEKAPYHQGAPITVETKSSWASMIRFLAALQAPANFVAIESADLKTDPDDTTTMHGTFTIAKWYVSDSVD